MKIYAGIDLHSNNIYLVLQGEDDRVVYEKRLPNEIDLILTTLEPFKAQIEGIVVESTFNGYWLIDGLKEAGYSVKMANPSAIKQYSGIKHSNDKTDAHWLCQLLKLNLIKESYICPKERRSTRDLLRRRGFLVQQRTANILSVQSTFMRNLATRLSANKIKVLTEEEIQGYPLLEDTAFGVIRQIKLIQYLEQQLLEIEKQIKKRLKATDMKGFRKLQKVPGIGEILTMTILLETGEIERFQSPKNYASYCRVVNSRRESNGKKKGENNRKNGNRYLAWAYMEAANFAIRSYPAIQKYYQRKMSTTNRVLALKTVAHKLACGCYFVLKNGDRFEINKSF